MALEEGGEGRKDRQQWRQVVGQRLNNRWAKDRVGELREVISSGGSRGGAGAGGGMGSRAKLTAMGAEQIA